MLIMMVRSCYQYGINLLAVLSLSLSYTIASETDIKHMQFKWRKFSNECECTKNNKTTLKTRKVTTRTTRTLIILMDNRKTSWNSKSLDSSRKNFTGKQCIWTWRLSSGENMNYFSVSFVRSEVFQLLVNFWKFLLNVWLIYIPDCNCCCVFGIWFICQWSFVQFSFSLANKLSRSSDLKRNPQQFIRKSKIDSWTFSTPVSTGKLSRVNIP